VINHHRASGRRKRLLASALEAGLGDEISKSPGPGEWLIQMEDESAIASAMQKISSQEREILLLKYTEGWGYQDLAEHLGVSVKTVEYRLLKARQALRSKLVEFCK
jgi:RNA polymerase sigma-70 factor (ECF subfamily)